MENVDRDAFYEELSQFAQKLVGPKGKYPNMPLLIEKDSRGKYGSLIFRVRGESKTPTSNVEIKEYGVGGGSR